MRRVKWGRLRIGIIMSCRIDRLVVGEDLVVLCISGEITGQDVEVLRTSLQQERTLLAIDLKGLLLVDREAIALLALRENGGTELRNCPAYIREWVSRERAAMCGSGQKQTIEGREDIDDV